VPGRIRLSVVIVTYNSSDAVAVSLPPLTVELGEGDELIVVDNASADHTVECVRDLAPTARLIQQDDNVGFAASCNAGAAIARGDLLVFLNPDAAVADGFADAIRRPLAERRGLGAWMGLVTAERGAVVNSRGGVIHFTGIAWAGGSGEPAHAAPVSPRDVPFASGACLAVPRDEWERLGGFSTPFFMYSEDVELSLRLWLWGGRVGIEPTARVDHDYEFAKGDQKWRLLERNRWAMILRVYPAPLLALLTPALLATELALLLIASRSGWGGAKRQAVGDTLRALPRLLRERRAIQARRAVGAGEFARLLTPDLASPYLGRAGRSLLLRLALRAYWSVVLALLTHISGPHAGSPRRGRAR
jgi:N-acetylglucosaminyl-diphospho-decaprenol L-rhamnosyltransferase